MKFIMQRLAVPLALVTTACALTCLTSGPEGKDWGPSCSNTSGAPLADACYIPVNSKGGTNGGCLPVQYASGLDISESACTEGGCWCLTDNCNTKEWATDFFSNYTLAPKCWSGVAGSNTGPTCEKSELYTSSEYQRAECGHRAFSNQCVENNKGVGRGDGCGDKQDQNSCENYQRGSRSLDESFDGTDKHCRWIAALTMDQKMDKCQVDPNCKFYSDRGDCSAGPGNCTGNCEYSDDANTNISIWHARRGMDCDMRMKSGCFENNGWMGQAERCSQHKAEDVCLAQTQDCSEGVCSGNATSGKACGERHSEGECLSHGMPNPPANGCSWKKQCCQWKVQPSDPVDTCMNNGKGTMDGVCTYSDGEGPPSKETVEAGFDHGLFKKRNKFTGQCALIASFRTGNGSATVLGSNKPNLLGGACLRSAPWKSFAEHVGHTDASIDEYCTNFIPDASAMAAFTIYTPAFIIKKIEQGQFDAVFPGLVGVMFLVTAKPEFGKCFFMAQESLWGAAVCVCDKAECNGKTALDLIVDGDIGPMRLLQFIDGSLVDMKGAVNNVVPGLMDADGRLNVANVGNVTEATIVELMKVDGMTNKTNKDELWNITQDHQKLVKAEMVYKTSLMGYPIFKALEISASSVRTVNKAAGVPLYAQDGVPMTLILQSLSATQVSAVSATTGISEIQLKEGRTQAWNKEQGIMLTTTTTSTTTMQITQSTGITGSTTTLEEVMSMGKIELKMSKANATALATSPDASMVFAKAIATTTNVSASDVTIIAIYVDGALVAGSRRLTSESTVRVDWTIKGADIKVAAMNATNLKTSIEVNAEAIGLVIAITAPPEVTIAKTPTLVPGLSAASTLCLAGLVSFLLMSTLLL